MSFHRKLLKSDSQDIVKQQVSAAPPLDTEAKNRKPKTNNKKKDSTPAESVEVVVGMNPSKESKKKTKSISKDDDVSVKTDSGIVDEPSESSAAAKKKSKSRRQREKKAAAAMVAAQQQDQQVPESSKESHPKEKIVIDLTPEKGAQAIASAAVIAKPKDKRKKSKSSSIDQKSKDDQEKVQFDQW